MCEILTEIIPYSNLEAATNIQLRVANDANFRPYFPSEEELMKSDPPLKELETKKEFIGLMRNAWKADPKARPKFEEIVDLLKEMESRL